MGNTDFPYTPTPIEEFELREYSKTELAKLYFPRQSEESARHNLFKDIRRCKALHEVLTEMLKARESSLHFCHGFTVEEVKFIVFYLGEPGE